jgi:hypothetical protein
VLAELAVLQPIKQDSLLEVEVEDMDIKIIIQLLQVLVILW